MDTVFVNSGNNIISDLHRLLLKFLDKTNLRRSDKYVDLYICYTWKNVKKSYKNNEFKISAPTWNKEFEFTHESYSVSDIQDYFEYFIKNIQK